MGWQLTIGCQAELDDGEHSRNDVDDGHESVCHVDVCCFVYPGSESLREMDKDAEVGD
jgi:hypothetical protein